MLTRHRPAEVLGARVKRVEDPRFLTGRGRYVDDIVRPDMLHVAFVRSTFAHADIASIDDRRGRAGGRARRRHGPTSSAWRGRSRATRCTPVAAHGALGAHGRPGAVRRRDHRRRGRRRTATSPRTPSTSSTSSTRRSRCCTRSAPRSPGRRPAARRLGGQLLRQAPPQGRRARPGVRGGAGGARPRDHAPQLGHPARELRVHRGVRRDQRPAHALDVDPDPAPRPHRPGRRAADARAPDPRGRTRRRRRLRHQGPPVPRGDRCWCWRS